MNNYDAIKGFTREEMAVFLRACYPHGQGWSYQELLAWLSKKDNISNDIKSQERKDFYELHG